MCLVHESLYCPRSLQFVDLSSTIAAAISLVFCAFVLFFALYIWRDKQARVHLDRISFRLSLWAMAAQIIQDIVYITLYAPVSEALKSCHPRT